MIYLRKDKELIKEEYYKLNSKEILIPVYDDEFTSICPECGNILDLDIEELKDILRNGEFFSTSIYCQKCSKGIRDKKRADIR